jgi:hypothetical protein
MCEMSDHYTKRTFKVGDKVFLRNHSSNLVFTVLAVDGDYYFVKGNNGTAPFTFPGKHLLPSGEPLVFFDVGDVVQLIEGTRGAAVRNGSYYRILGKLSFKGSITTYWCLDTSRVPRNSLDALGTLFTHNQLKLIERGSNATNGGSNNYE